MGQGSSMRSGGHRMSLPVKPCKMAGTYRIDGPLSPGLLVAFLQQMRRSSEVSWGEFQALLKFL